MRDDVGVSLLEKSHDAGTGKIVYWVTANPSPSKPWLIFLPGLTADHRLFNSQIEYFRSSANVLVWDPPSHGRSSPFSLDWSLDDLARWLHEVLEAQNICQPILVGQSMGGYVAQDFMRLYPGYARGFVSIDSCPLGSEYYARWELFFLRHTKLMYRSFPWGALKSAGANGCATTDAGKRLMREMMEDYEKREYCDLASHGFKVLAEAISPDRDYSLECPALLICGSKDMAGSAKRYNKNWSRRTGIPVNWIEGAGHNSNTDAPDVVNSLIESFIELA